MLMLEVTGLAETPEQPRNKYEFWFEFSHGDADHTDYESFLINPEDLPRVLVLLDGIEQAEYCGRDAQWDIPEFEWFFGDDLPRDVTYRDVPVRVSFLKVYYYNFNGEKHNAVIKKA